MEEDEVVTEATVEKGVREQQAPAAAQREQAWRTQQAQRYGRVYPEQHL
jgi:hypothetical protein